MRQAARDLGRFSKAKTYSAGYYSQSQPGRDLLIGRRLNMNSSSDPVLFNLQPEKRQSVQDSVSMQEPCNSFISAKSWNKFRNHTAVMSRAGALGRLPRRVNLGRAGRTKIRHECPNIRPTERALNDIRRQTPVFRGRLPERNDPGQFFMMSRSAFSLANPCLSCAFSNCPMAKTL